MHPVRQINDSNAIFLTRSKLHWNLTDQHRREELIVSMQISYAVCIGRHWSGNLIASKHLHWMDGLSKSQLTEIRTKVCIQGGKQWTWFIILHIHLTHSLRRQLNVLNIRWKSMNLVHYSSFPSDKLAPQAAYRYEYKVKINESGSLFFISIWQIGAAGSL